MRGKEVTVVSGGMPLAGMESGKTSWVQLEPLRSDGLDFGRLVGAHGEVADTAVFARRSQQLLDTFRRCRPRVVVIETFPFGRRQFRSELGALLEAAHAAGERPVVVSSVRDILQRRDARREAETVRMIEQAFDVVLVHGDPALIPLDASFDAAHHIREKTVYTGYIAPAPVPRAPPDGLAGGEIVVSAGGGAAGLRLYESALEAARGDSSGRRWRLLVGGALTDEQFERLRRLAPPSVEMERNRVDFRELIAACGLLVSQAGYNTVADILVTGVPSLLVPFEGVGETEQLERARCFGKLGRCGVLRERDLSARALLDRVSGLLAAPEPIVPAMNLDGIAVAADRLCEYACAKSSRGQAVR